MTRFSSAAWGDALDREGAITSGTTITTLKDMEKHVYYNYSRKDAQVLRPWHLSWAALGVVMALDEFATLSQVTVQSSA